MVLTEALRTTLGLLAFIVILLVVLWFLLRRQRATAQRLTNPSDSSLLPPVSVSVDSPMTAMESAAPLSAAVPLPVPAAKPPPPDAGYQELAQRLRQVESLLGRLATQPPSPPATPVTAANTTLAPDDGMVIRNEVYRLADDGVPYPVIAQHLSLSRSEVELLLELRRIRATLAPVEPI